MTREKLTLPVSETEKVSNHEVEVLGRKIKLTITSFFGREVESYIKYRAKGDLSGTSISGGVFGCMLGNDLTILIPRIKKTLEERIERPRAIG